jgi:hypothetical protein
MAASTAESESSRNVECQPRSRASARVSGPKTIVITPTPVLPTPAARPRRAWNHWLIVMIPTGKTSAWPSPTISPKVA